MNMKVIPHLQCLDLTLKEIGMIWQHSFSMPDFDQNYATKEISEAHVFITYLYS